MRKSGRSQERMCPPENERPRAENRPIADRRNAK